MDMEFTIYKTADLYYSAFLLSIEIELTGTETQHDSNKEKVVFVFKLPKGKEKHLKWLYFSGKGQVPAMKFVNSIRMLKELTHT